MKRLIKLEKWSDLCKLDLKGIEITEAKSGTGGTDFKGIELKDTVTNTILRIEMGPYSDMNVFTEKQKEYTKKFVVTGKEEKALVTATFDTEKEAQDWIEYHTYTEAKIAETNVEVVE